MLKKERHLISPDICVDVPSSLRRLDLVCTSAQGTHRVQMACLHVLGSLLGVIDTTGLRRP